MIHAGEKPFSCNIYLKAHEKIHTEEKPFCCTMCEYKTLSKSCLKMHEKTHTEEKPFCCNMCGYKTSYITYLKMHEKVHKGNEKPFFCIFCDYRTFHISTLKKHEKLHTWRSNFRCFCGYKTDLKNNFKLHEKIHIGEKRLCCNFCDYKTYYNFYLKRHIKIHIGETFYGNISFEKHENICPQKMSFQCSINNLNHVRQDHSQCKWCNYMTVAQTLLSKQENSTTIKKSDICGNEFNCHLCDYKITDKREFESHESSHFNDHVTLNILIQLL